MKYHLYSSVTSGNPTQHNVLMAARLGVEENTRCRDVRDRHRCQCGDGCGVEDQRAGG